MAIDSDYLLAREWPEVTHRYTEKDWMLYALGFGLGRDPLSQDEPRFVYEDGLKVMPTQAVTLAHPGFWAVGKDINLDWVKLLHLGQEIIWHQPLPTVGEIAANTHFTDVGDKGARAGALIVTERVVRLIETGEVIATVITTILARGDREFSSERRSVPQERTVFPIVSLMKVCCHYDPERLKRIRLRFSAPVYPGETIRTEIWQEEKTIAFRCWSPEQGKVVINNDYLEII